MLMPVTLAGADVLPARSVTVVVAVWFAPSVVFVTVGQPGTPEPTALGSSAGSKSGSIAEGSTPDANAPGSPQVNVAVTLVLLQPFALGAGVRPAPAMVGAVLSILTVTTFEAVAWPALSVAVPWTGVPAVSAVRGTAAGQLATPDSPSSQAKETVTLDLFQPKALGPGLGVAAIVGATRSRPSVTSPVTHGSAPPTHASGLV